jgi:4-aminobutyrate aminotransferase-like enzyme
VFRIKKRFFPSCNRRSCALQHDFLRRKKIFHIVKFHGLTKLRLVQTKKNRRLSTGFFPLTDAVEAVRIAYSYRFTAAHCAARRQGRAERCA